MKASEVTVEIIKSFLRVVGDDDNALLEKIIAPAALRHIQGYTGLTENEIDAREDITLAYLVLISHMFDNRSMIVDSDRANRVVEAIIDKHSVNLL